jgi:hypothetical protein
MPLDLEVVAHSSERPLPTRNPFSEPFWDAAARHELALQRCDQCATFRFYPRPMCPQCHSMAATWTTCSGHGTIYTFTIVRRPLARWFRERVPLVCAIVELDEGPRMMANIHEVDPDQVSIGTRVAVRFEDVDEDITLPYFVPGDRQDDSA